MNATLSYYYHYALLSVGSELMAAFEDILHLSAAENGCHEEQAEQGQHETYPEIKSAGSHAAKFATEYVI